MNVRYDYKVILLFAVLVASILLALFLSYDKYLVRKDFLIEVNVPCKDSQESCFKQECDSQDPRCDSDGMLYFKIVEKWGYVNASPEECAISNQCDVIYCNDSNVGIYSDYESCFLIP